MATERTAWIDWTKGISILAVCLDHLIVHDPDMGEGDPWLWPCPAVSTF